MSTVWRRCVCCTKPLACGCILMKGCGRPKGTKRRRGLVLVQGGLWVPPWTNTPCTPPCPFQPEPMYLASYIPYILHHAPLHTPSNLNQCTELAIYHTSFTMHPSILLPTRTNAPYIFHHVLSLLLPSRNNSLTIYIYIGHAHSTGQHVSLLCAYYEVAKLLVVYVGIPIW